MRIVGMSVMDLRASTTIGARDRSGGCCCYALNERAQLRIAGKFLVEWPCDHDHQIDGKKNAQRSSDGAAPAVDNVANESHGDYHRARSDHGHGNSVNELLFGEPVAFQHNAAMEKRHNRQSAAEYEQARLDKEEQNLEKQRRACAHSCRQSAAQNC